MLQAQAQINEAQQAHNRAFRDGGEESRPRYLLSHVAAAAASDPSLSKDEPRHSLGRSRDEMTILAAMPAPLLAGDAETVPTPPPSAPPALSLPPLSLTTLFYFVDTIDRARLTHTPRP